MPYRYHGCQTQQRSYSQLRYRGFWSYAQVCSEQHRFPICTAYIRIFSLAIFRQPSALSYSATIIFASLLLYRRSMLPNSTSMTLSTASLFQVRVNSAPAVYLLLSPERTLFLNGPLESPLISRKGSFSQPDTLSDRILKLVFSDISTSVLTFVLPPVKVTDNL
jgi:hypothetical protein